MKHREVCPCGAEIEIEDDDGMSLRQEIRNWRQAHLCAGVRGQYVGSSTDLRTEIGFTPERYRPMEAM